jgi:hypothetical protein
LSEIYITAGHKSHPAIVEAEKRTGRRRKLKGKRGHDTLEIETRTITTSEMMNTYAAWPGVAQVYRLERHFIWRRNGKSIKMTSEVEYGITSLTRNEATPEYPPCSLAH